MAAVTQRLLLDTSVVIKWKLAGEAHAAEARELLQNWRQNAVEVVAPDLLRTELTSALLRAHRRGRISQTEAKDYLRDLLPLPFVIHAVSLTLASRAFDIACAHSQGAHDCIYVALAEQESIDFWTGDQRLYNALQSHFPFVAWIGNYTRRRPSP
jgi:predicted nucleic acid-binding protein